MSKLFFLFVICGFGVQAQDTIRFRNGEVKSVKVIEVGLNEIKYNRFDNIGGPVYRTPKNDVSGIKYANGFTDTFAIVSPEVKPNLEIATQIKVEKIRIDGKRLFYHGMRINENQLQALAFDFPPGPKRDKLNRIQAEMKLHKKRQHFDGFILGLAAGVGAPYIGMIAGIATQNEIPIIAGLIIGASVGITGAVLSIDNKRKRTAKRLEFARVYNE